MKRLLLFFTIVTLGVTSCSPPFLSRFKNNDRQMADEKLKKIIAALESGNNEALKGMFSKRALAEATDIDDGIKYAIQFYHGKMISQDGALDVLTQKDGKENKKIIKAFYTVKTDNDTFIVFFIDQTENTVSPDEVGLFMLQVIKESDRKEQFDWGGEKTYCAGVYRPKSNK
jgi:hypothetical protein